MELSMPRERMISYWKPVPFTGICGRRISAQRIRCKGVLSNVWNIEKKLLRLLAAKSGLLKKSLLFALLSWPVCSFTVCRPLYRGGGVGIR